MLLWAPPLPLLPDSNAVLLAVFPLAAPVFAALLAAVLPDAAPVLAAELPAVLPVFPPVVLALVVTV